MTKLSFTIIVEGNPSIENKFEEAIEDIPEIQDDLMFSMFTAINLAFRFDLSDQITLKRFSAEKIICSKAAIG